MVNLLCLICSLCINFATVGFTYPYDFTESCEEYYSSYMTCWEYLLQQQYNINPDYGILVHNTSSHRYHFYYPNESLLGSGASSISITERRDTGFLRVSMTNWSRFDFNEDLSFRSYASSNSSLGTCCINPSSASSNVIVYNTYYDLPLNDVDTFNWRTEVVPIGFGSGSLGAGGHSSGGSPIDELNNNGVTWSSIQGNFTSSGHSVQNVTTPPSADPNSNLELILSGFLGGILNNTNDLLGNTSQLGTVLGGVSNNVIQGASAVFNAISNLNNTIIDLVNYIREPLDQERISAKLEEVPIYQTINSLVGFSDSFLSSINSIQDPEHLYLTMDFRNANEPFRRLGLYVFDFTFLDNLKSTWQPILLAVLYVTLGVNIFYDLPNIVHGISGLSGGDD